jgi:Arc/MetJ-type ribon-helix-helix transcriptional regulator
MTITNPDVARLIEEQLNTGRYTSADEVLLAGLKLLQERENGKEENGKEENGTPPPAPNSAAQREAQRLLQQPDGPGPEERTNDMKVVIAMIEEISKQVPDSEWEKVPPDFSQNIDHYLYGAPKRY